MYELLKQLCQERNTNISNLCIEATGNSGNLATWRKGHMRSDYLAKCADILGVSTDYILQRNQGSEVDELIKCEIALLSEDQKREVLKYIKFVKSE